MEKKITKRKEENKKVERSERLIIGKENKMINDIEKGALNIIMK